MSEQMTFLDFFSGIGGFRAGLELCGIKCKGHCEIDKYADRSYRAIYDIKEDEWYGEDITKVKPEELPRVNIWTGGFPCQDISISGKQVGLDGNRSGLFFEIIRLLKGKEPKDRPDVDGSNDKLPSSFLLNPANLICVSSFSLSRS